MTTLQEKLVILKDKHPEVYEVLVSVVPHLVEKPDEATKDELDQYNFWIDSLDEDEAQSFYHAIELFHPEFKTRTVVVYEGT